MIDQNGKLFGKVSIIDIGIVVVIALCTVGIYFRFAGGVSEINTKKVDIEYVFVVKQIRQTSVNALMKKGDLYNKTAGQDYMGTITDVKAISNDDFSVLADGTIVKTSAPDRFDALVTVKTSGKKTGNSVLTSTNQRVDVGSRIYLSSKWVVCEGDIKSVNILEQ